MNIAQLRRLLGMQVLPAVTSSPSRLQPVLPGSREVCEMSLLEGRAQIGPILMGIFTE